MTPPMSGGLNWPGIGSGAEHLLVESRLIPYLTPVRSSNDQRLSLLGFHLAVVFPGDGGQGLDIFVGTHALIQARR